MNCEILTLVRVVTKFWVLSFVPCILFRPDVPRVTILRGLVTIVLLERIRRLDTSATTLKTATSRRADVTRTTHKTRTTATTGKVCQRCPTGTLLAHPEREFRAPLSGS